MRKANRTIFSVGVPVINPPSCASMWVEGAPTTIRSHVICKAFPNKHFALYLCAVLNFKGPENIFFQSASHYEWWGLTWTYILLPKLEHFWSFYMRVFFMHCFVCGYSPWTFLDSVPSPTDKKNQNLNVMTVVDLLPDHCQSNLMVPTWKTQPENSSSFDWTGALNQGSDSCGISLYKSKVKRMKIKRQIKCSSLCATENMVSLWHPFSFNHGTYMSNSGSQVYGLTLDLRFKIGFTVRRLNWVQITTQVMAPMLCEKSVACINKLVHLKLQWWCLDN